MTNHIHLLLRTGTVSVASIMRKLLTGYAVARRVQVDRSAVSRAVRRVENDPDLFETARVIRGAFEPVGWGLAMASP